MTNKRTRSVSVPWASGWVVPSLARARPRRGPARTQPCLHQLPDPQAVAKMVKPV